MFAASTFCALVFVDFIINEARKGKRRTYTKAEQDAHWAEWQTKQRKRKRMDK
jgi:hypothetical protein